MGTGRISPTPSNRTAPARSPAGAASTPAAPAADGTATPEGPPAKGVYAARADHAALGPNPQVRPRTREPRGPGVAARRMVLRAATMGSAALQGLSSRPVSRASAAGMAGLMAFTSGAQPLAKSAPNSGLLGPAAAPLSVLAARCLQLESQRPEAMSAKPGDPSAWKVPPQQVMPAGPAALFPTVDIAPSEGTCAPDAAAAVASVHEVIEASKAAGLYRQPIPNNQDGQAHALEGLGGAFIDAVAPMVFSPRRQTDQMVRQAFALLPESLTQQVAFVHAQRVAQDPEGAVRLLEGKQQVVIVGSLKGINTATSDDPKVSAIHEKELKALELTLQLSKALGVEVRDVVYGMGDSSPRRDWMGTYTPNPFAEQKRVQLEGRVQDILTANGYDKPEKLSWGADELMLSAFAAQLPERTLAVELQHPEARYFYDSDATAAHLVEEAAAKAGLTLSTAANAEMRLFAFGLAPEANRASDQLFPDARERVVQGRSDSAFAQRIRSLTPEERTRTVIVDARLNNGALDDAALPPALDMLGFSAWGTGGNNFGQGLAMAKIVFDAQSRARDSGDSTAAAHVEQARKQLLVESIAHDAFFIGYAEGASGVTVGTAGNNPLSVWMREANLPTAPGQRLQESQLVELYRRASHRTSAELGRRYPGFEGRVQFVPQSFHRRFEAATLYSEAALPYAGSISAAIAARYPEFHPAATYRDHVATPAKTPAVQANGRFAMD